MADLHPFEDQAVLYLLDRLPADERREFEARLAESAELRALLRELEDGTVAMAMTAPSHRPPKQIWQRIKKSSLKNESQKPLRHPAG
jgi:anti-sigma-K factor RskA